MVCAWKELLGILPQWLRTAVSQYEQLCIQEIRMRINSPPELVIFGQSKWLSRVVTAEDLNFCVNTASRYSPWAAATAAQGYLTAPGGHRIGLCGEAVVKEGQFIGIRTLSSLCIRVARDFPGISGKHNYHGQSILILGAPGWGKTTLLRDISRKLSDTKTVCVIDERQELFPPGFQTGRKMDILSGCPKAAGIECALRTMGPDIIAVDEITAPEDCRALIQAFGCGVTLLATAHGNGLRDFLRREVYAPLRESHIFDTFLILHADKSFSQEAVGCITNGSAQR